MENYPDTSDPSNTFYRASPQSFINSNASIVVVVVDNVVGVFVAVIVVVDVDVVIDFVVELSPGCDTFLLLLTDFKNLLILQLFLLLLHILSIDKM